MDERELYKKCTKRSKILLKTEFGSLPKSSDGLNYACKPCKRSY